MENIVIVIFDDTRWANSAAVDTVVRGRKVQPMDVTDAEASDIGAMKVWMAEELDGKYNVEDIYLYTRHLESELVTALRDELSISVVVTDI